MRSNEQKLIARCLKGNQQAMHELYGKHAPTMMAVCVRYMGNRTEAEDVLQEGFIKVFSCLDSFKNNGSFEGWVRRIMVNTALYHLRKSARMHAVAHIDEADASESDYVDVTSQLAANELMELVLDLPQSYRTVFNLYAIEGFSHKEIAEMLNISVGTSKSNLSDARRLLKKAVAQLQQLPESKQA